jgi:hypothetical protein
MTFGLTQLVAAPRENSRSGLWQVATTLVRRWGAYRRARWRNRISAGELSADWLRRHEVESAKHRDAHYG